MLNLPTSEATGLLERSIALAKRLELLVEQKRPSRRVDFVGYVLLVRNRRLAECILHLGAKWSYEGRILFRSLLEIYINYAWMRLKNSRTRATRYLRFASLERLQMLSDLRGTMEPRQFAESLKILKSRRRSTRHLFQYRDARERLVWAKDWTGGLSFADRLIAVLKSTDQHDPDGNFMYALYRWSSSAAHGGPVSGEEVIESAEGWPVPSSQPEEDTSAAMSAATLTLLVHVGVLAGDIDVVDDLGPELTDLTTIVERWTR